jgi:Ca2+-binding RTX toxin-like protein
MRGVGTGDGDLLDPFLRLLDFDGNEITSDDNSGGGVTNALIVHVAGYTGWHFLSAEHQGIGRTYELEFNDVSGAPIAVDVPDTDDTLVNVPLNGAVEGTIDAAGDEDWYAINLVAGVQYRFNLTELGGTLDPHLTLFDAGGSPITFDDNSGPGTDAEITFTATTDGLHFLGARDAADTETGTFLLAATLLSAPPSPVHSVQVVLDPTAVGSDLDDSIGGGDGTDDFNGGLGNDTVTGGAADDTLRGGNGNDSIDGGADDDSILGGEGSNTLVGGLGNDEVVGGFGNDTVDAGGGDDEVRAGQGNNSVDGGDGNDDIEAGSGDDIILAGLGDDTVTVQSGENLIDGGGGNDDLTGGGIEDTINGGEGNDTITGGDGSDQDNDRLSGGNGNDLFRNVNAGDLVSGGAGIDTVEALTSYTLPTTLVENLKLLGGANLNGFGNFANNNIQGNTGANQLFGLGGNDTILGGQGNDTITGGAGKDLNTGGGGLDRMDYNALSESGPTFAVRDAINTFAHGDKIDLSTIDANAKVAGNQAFTFVQNFSGQAGQLQWDQVATNSWFVSADVNGDGGAEFSLNIYTSPGFGQLQSWDFIL